MSVKRLEHPLGRLEPEDFEHVERYPMSAVLPTDVTTVEKVLALPGWHASHNQGKEGSCVGHAVAMERAITNRLQSIAAGATSKDATVRYDPIDVWNQAKIIDEWGWTNPGDENGTSVRAAYDSTRARGLCRVTTMRLQDGVPVPVGEQPPDAAAGVATNRWATTVDEIRTAIANGLPVVLGIRWYTAFDKPLKKSGAWWVADTEKTNLGTVRGGHSVCVYGASDKRQAVRLKNSWGTAYPLVWVPYPTLDRIVRRENGEAALVTDR